DRDLGGAAIAVDLVERRTRDAAGEQSPGLVDAEPMHAVKCRTGDEFGDLIGLRRGACGEKNRRCDSGTECKPARHDATSRCFMARVFAPVAHLANETCRRCHGVADMNPTPDAAPTIWIAGILAK